jgi:hypothetical protein
VYAKSFSAAGPAPNRLGANATFSPLISGDHGENVDAQVRATASHQNHTQNQHVGTL